MKKKKKKNWELHKEIKGKTYMNHMGAFKKQTVKQKTVVICKHRYEMHYKQDWEERNAGK